MRARLLTVLSASTLLLACAGLVGGSFEARDGKLEEGNLFSSSARASCTVKNLGDAPAPATVGYRLTLADGTTVTAEEYAMLNPKESKAVVHEFKDVRVRDREGATVECTARPAE